MTKKVDAVREVAEYWRKRYSAAQAIIEELQAEKKHIEFGLNDAIRTIEELRNDEQALYDRLDDQVIRCSETIGELQRALDEARERAAGWQKSANTAVIRVLKKLEDSRRWAAAWKAAAKRHRENVSYIIEDMARDEAIQNKRNKSAGGNVLPGAGLLGPYTPTADHFSILVGKDKGGQWTAEMRDIPNTPLGIDPIGSWTGESWQLEEDE